ncbi:transcriptional regulator [Sinimarinibacterium sp. NLF-5-8]|uniref:transcriptional regulator n=1 Tax=Sinimarinibacterium sp. NLF-5-8 TaxID=2698684 RepID=UPI00137C2EE0|nr:transcriptional regulator [Sinimarinibacterium sp. NLF-5-8]QHS10179.1 transcriptional regulator [Sinimarinibacterium sp. NLF-5-8]
MKDEKAAFAERLRAAMRAQRLAPRAAVLEKLFNTHYYGQPVSIQSVAAWLGGRSIPKQDKLKVLAEVLGVEPQQLQYGSADLSHAPAVRSESRHLSAQDQQMIETLLTLPAAQRKVLRSLVAWLGATADDPKEDGLS